VCVCDIVKSHRHTILKYTHTLCYTLHTYSTYPSLRGSLESQSELVPGVPTPAVSCDAVAHVSIDQRYITQSAFTWYTTLHIALNHHTLHYTTTIYYYTALHYTSVPSTLCPILRHSTPHHYTTTLHYTIKLQYTQLPELHYTTLH
jgi:hypothetical protein